MANKEDYQTNGFGPYDPAAPVTETIRPITYTTQTRARERNHRNDFELTTFGRENIYTSYAGVDIVAQLVIPNEAPMVLGELQTISYSIHRENTPVRLLGRTNVAGFVKGPRTIAGSLIFTVFNNYAFYRLEQYQYAITKGLYPLADMLPPFDVVLTFANENGVFSKMKIYGITITDEGGTMSIDDLITEQTYTYMARGIQPMTGYFIRSGDG